MSATAVEPFIATSCATSGAPEGALATRSAARYVPPSGLPGTRVGRSGGAISTDQPLFARFGYGCTTRMLCSVPSGRIERSIRTWRLDLVSARRVSSRRPIVDAPRREPKSMRARQLAFVVRDGRKLTFSVFDDESITGYLAGEDDESYFVLQPVDDRFVQNLILKLLNPRIVMHPESTYDEEACREEMDRIIAPFRTRILHDFFGTQPAARIRKAG